MVETFRALKVTSTHQSSRREEHPMTFHRQPTTHGPQPFSESDNAKILPGGRIEDLVTASAHPRTHIFKEFDLKFQLAGIPQVVGVKERDQIPCRLVNPGVPRERHPAVRTLD